MTEAHLARMIEAGEAGHTKGNCSMGMVDALSEVGSVPRRLYRKARECFLKGDTGPDTNRRLLTEACEAAGMPIDADKNMSGKCVTPNHLREDFERAKQENAIFAVRTNARSREVPHILGVKEIKGNQVTLVGVCEKGKTRQEISMNSLIKRMRKVAARQENNACLLIRK